jgi:organic radical activating enzyme
MKNNMVKIRVFEESNYKAVWHKGKTIRIALDPTKPITELAFPEFYDIKLTDYCKGKCPWCYMDSKDTDSHFVDVIQKIKDYFGPMSKNERPFQVAIGGGEPTEHPDFIEVLKTFSELGIEPNYTTNGMFVDYTSAEASEKEINILENTQKYCGGVAVSCHPHLQDYWEVASRQFLKYKAKLNFHLIISDKESIDTFKEIYDKWSDKIDYFVLLPYGNQGRAEDKIIDWKYLVEVMPENTAKIAFGANFYPYLKDGKNKFDVSLYEPEIMSKFLDLKDMKLYKSSFNLEENV